MDITYRYQSRFFNNILKGFGFKPKEDIVSREKELDIHNNSCRTPNFDHLNPTS